MWTYMFMLQKYYDHDALYINLMVGNSTSPYELYNLVLGSFHAIGLN